MDLKKLMEHFREKKIKKDQLLILFLIGILLMVIAVPTEKKEDSETYETIQNISSTDNTEYAQYLECQLENILSQMEGAGDVVCMVTLKSSAEQIIEKDLDVQDEVVTEEDSQGGKRTTNQTSRSEATIYNGEESGTPYVSKEISPKVEGVVVIADGGDNAVVVKNITEAIQALFGIESHKIRIVKKGG